MQIVVTGMWQRAQPHFVALWKALCNALCALRILRKHQGVASMTEGPAVVCCCLQVRGLVPHEEVQAFHAQHYSSNLMRGAVVGRQPSAELEALVRAKFGAVPNTNLPVPQFPGRTLPPSVFPL